MFLEDHEIDFPDPLDATTRRRAVHSFADQSVCLSLGAAFASPGCFFQIDTHRDHAQIEARGGFARLPRDAFSCSLFNSLRNLGDIEQSGIISALSSYGSTLVIVNDTPSGNYEFRNNIFNNTFAKTSDWVGLLS